MRTTSPHLLAGVPKSWIAVPFFLLFFWLALAAVVNDSPTMDEQNHLARGLAFLRTGDPRLSLEHPPLINSLSALPVALLLDVQLPFDHPSWDRPEGWYEFAEIMLWERGNDVPQMIFLSRLPIIFLTMGLGLIGFHFGRELWGAPAGLVALFALLFDPNILAHGRYTTTDIGGTTFLLLAAFMLWRLWTAPSGRVWSRIFFSGLALGLAFGSKLSTLIFVPIFALLAVLPLYGDRWGARPAGKRLGHYLLAGFLSIGMVWIIFGLQWAPFQFQTAPLSTLNAVSGPMPTFWAGLEQIAGLGSAGRGAAFLLGEFSTSGFISYFPVAFLVKTPLASLILFGVATIILLWKRETRGRALFLLLPAALFFLAGMQSALNIGYRHLLPVLALFTILIAGLAPLAVRLPRSRPAGALARLGLGLGLAGILAATLWIHPHYLSYFNLAAGGPANGYNILIDSNIDWGQDLLRLQEWMAANDVDRVKLSWFGSADPAYYGIAYDPLPGLPRHFDLWWSVPFNPSQPEPGIYAISVSNLWEIPLQDEKVVFPWFREREPDDRVGYSILIYRVVDG